MWNTVKIWCNKEVLPSDTKNPVLRILRRCMEISGFIVGILFIALCEVSKHTH